MNAKLALVLLLVVGCRPEHEVRLLLGPDENSLSVGFRCEDDTGTPLMMRAGVAGHLSIVIDGMAITGGAPGCRSEDLANACAGTGRCSAPSSASERFCVDIDVSKINFDPADPAGSLKRLYEAIGSQTLRRDAPDEITIVRAIATTATCTEFFNMTPMDLADKLVGCAYSCPVQLDQVANTLSLSLDTLDRQCERTVQQCALFPNISKL